MPDANQVVRSRGGYLVRSAQATRSSRAIEVYGRDEWDRRRKAIVAKLREQNRGREPNQLRHQAR